jgi:hypothetical protein
MSGGSVLWSEVPEDEKGKGAPDCEAHGDVDETFAARRLRRWLSGMFGGGAEPAAEPDEPGRGESS